jgi:putative ABC transport system permease protein
MPTMLTDTAFFDTFSIPFIAGQGIAGAAQGSYVLSEDAAHRLGWTPQQAIGKWLELTCCNMPRGIVTAVVADVMYGSARSAMGPMLYVVPSEPQDVITNETRLGLQQIAIKLQGADVQTSLAGIEQVWKQFRADQPLTRSFVSDDFAELYVEETRQGNMLIAFAVLAIFITCLGLYGLATFNAQRRTREIGVRKVMGSSVWGIVVLLTNDFSRLVLLSNVIAWPVAYIAMQRWLENFAYRIDLAPVVFIGSGLIALCVAWATVGSTAAKAANARPVLALKYE